MGIFDFFKLFIKNPKEVGAIAPSSKFLARAIADQTTGPIVVEIGAGTGSLTKGLAEKFKAGHLYVVEIEDSMCKQLSELFPQCNVIQGDATKLASVLPTALVGNVDTVVSGIPLLNLKEKDRKAIIDACFATLKKDGCIIQFTYSPLCPIPLKKWGLYGKRMDYVLKNTPPAFVWKFSRMPI